MSDTKTEAKKSTVNVFLKTDAGEVKHEVGGGLTKVSDLKVELGVPAAETLFEKVQARGSASSADPIVAASTRVLARESAVRAS